MKVCVVRLLWVLIVFGSLVSCLAQGSKQSDSSSSSSRSRKTAKTTATDSGLDAGAVTNGVYRNKSLVLSCKIPAGWVLRTEEMKARDDSETTPEKNPRFSQNQGEL